MRTNAENFVKKCANESVLRGKFVGKIRNFDGFGVVFPHVCINKSAILHGGAKLRSKVYVYRCRCVCVCVNTAPNFQVKFL